MPFHPKFRACATWSQLTNINALLKPGIGNEKVLPYANWEMERCHREKSQDVNREKMFLRWHLQNLTKLSCSLTKHFSQKCLYFQRYLSCLKLLQSIYINNNGLPTMECFIEFYFAIGIKYRDIKAAVGSILSKLLKWSVLPDRHTCDR